MDGHSRQGGFDTLRLLAALMVFVSHAFAIAGLPEPGLPGYTLGGVAVVIFFAMSGYWVTRSALERSVASFTAARALRLVPGLLVCCAVTILVCALATSLVVNDYLQQPKTWAWLRNALPLLVPQRGALPGVFEDGPLNGVNSSLWTLPYEVFCYLLIAIAARFGPKGVRFAIALMLIYATGVLIGPIDDGLIRLTSDLDRRWFALYGGAFFLGAALNAASNRALCAIIAIATVAVALTRGDADAAGMSGVFLYGAAAILVGRNVDLDRRLTRGRDISYGVYIYAFPLTQLAMRAVRPHDGASFAAYCAVALLATLAFAWASWTLVERPALRLKGRLAGVIERGAERLPFSAMRARFVGWSAGL